MKRRPVRAWNGIAVTTIGHMTYGASNGNTATATDIEPYRRESLNIADDFHYGDTVMEMIRSAVTEAQITRALSIGRHA